MFLNRRQNLLALYSVSHARIRKLYNPFSNTANQVPTSLLGDTDDNAWRRLEEWIGNRSDLVEYWNPVMQLKASAEAALKPYHDRYKKLERQWQLKLKPLCGDFYQIEWERFRPLRHSREEDWSDWLAWLLETSVTGLLAETVLGSFVDCDLISFRSPDKRVKREVPTENGERRADVVAEWSKYLVTHIEVKLGDQNFEKTFETCRFLRDKYSEEAKLVNAILIPETSRAVWRGAAEKHPKNDIKEILWEDVVHGLRKCLWAAREPIFWQCWAWCFCSAIESRILHLLRPSPSRQDFTQLARAARWVSILAMDLGEADITLKPEMNAFLKDGIRLYFDAVDAVTVFETEMKKLLKRTVDARTNWESLSERRVKPPTADGGDDGRYIYTFIECKSPVEQNLKIECGLWWKAPQMTGPIVYAGIFRRNLGVKFDWNEAGNEIRSFEYFDRTFLHLPLPASADLEAPVNQLLDAILRQLRKMTPEKLAPN
jgi:hypothetical protein